ncbi:MAG: urate hydroxylase PuuD, partial [Deltaproteobacteria bacterium]
MKPTQFKEYREKWDLVWQYFRDRHKNSIDETYEKFKTSLIKIKYMKDDTFYFIDNREKEDKERYYKFVNDLNYTEQRQGEKSLPENWGKPKLPPLMPPPKKGEVKRVKMMKRILTKEDITKEETINEIKLILAKVPITEADIDLALQKKNIKADVVNKLKHIIKTIIPDPPKEGVEGEVWMVHSGGFYQVERRKIGPGTMPKTLHWFKWEAAFTWITGVLLMAVVYYSGGGALLFDAVNTSSNVPQAIGFSLLLLPFSWLIYDSLWNSPLGKNVKLATLLSFIFMVGLVYGLSKFFGGRAAYMHVGAVFGTIMVANVWMRILPAQQKMIDATQEGKQPDFTLSAKAKLRSVHNSYLTLPVLFLMLSNHYPMTYGSEKNGVIL